MSIGTAIGVAATVGTAAYAASQMPDGSSGGSGKGSMGIDTSGITDYHDLVALQQQAGDIAGQQQLKYDQLKAQQVLQMAPHIQQVQNKLNAEQRASDLNLLKTYGSQYQQTLENLDPTFGNAMKGLNAQVGQVGPSPILGELQNQAQSELALGRSLSPEQLRDATQSVRQGMSDRGMIQGNAGMAAELLGRDSYANAMQQQRQQFATGVENLSEQQQGNDRGFLESTAQIGQNALQPLMGFFGKQGVDVRTGAAISAGPNVIGAGQSTANTWLGAQQNQWDTMYNANAAQQIAAGNNQAALLGASIGAMGNMTGSYMNYRSSIGG